MTDYQLWTKLVLGFCIWFGAASVFSQDDGISIPIAKETNLQFIYVPAGEFLQGSPETEQGRKTDETLRTVKLSSGFLIGKYPITVGQFKAFVAETNYKTEAEIGTSGGFGLQGKELVQRSHFNWKSPGFTIADDHPVCLVTVLDAKAFLSWLSKKTNRNFVLPSEAQWEFACRAGTQSRFSNGDDQSDLDQLGWYLDNSGDGTRPVGKKTPNALGLHDMSGNVFEWCSDIYAKYPSGPTVDPLQKEPDAGDKVRNVLRGGSWLRRADNCRSAARYRNDAHSRNADNGFRVCCLIQSELTAEDFKKLGGESLEYNSKPQP